MKISTPIIAAGKRSSVRRFINTSVRCAVFLFSVLHASNGFANLYAPNTFTDPAFTSVNNANGMITGGAGVGLVSLRSALQAADALGGSHTITLSTGTYNLSKAPKSQITIGNTSQNITIVGNGPANTIVNMVNDANKDRILFINPVGTTNNVITNVSGIKFQNGSLTSDNYGGAGICAGGGLGNALSVTNCSFDDNFIPVNSFGGAAVCMQVSGDLTVDNSTFNNNISNDADGGAILFIIFNNNPPGYDGDLSVTNSTFTGNSVAIPGAGTSNGGALAFTGQGGIVGTFNVTINNNTFINNTADGLGGAISANNSPNISTSQIHFNRFFNNTSAASSLSSGLHFVESAGSVNADNNWWGCNTNPVNGASTSPCNQVGGDAAGGGTLILTKWLQLKTTASPTTICNTAASTPTNTSTITTSFLSNSANEAISPANLSRLIGSTVTWGPTTLGSLSAQQATIQASGTATATFTSNGTGGIATVNTGVDNVPAGETSPARASITVNTASVAPTGATGVTTVCSGGSTTLTVDGGTKGTAAVTQWFTGSCGGTLVFTGDALNTGSLNITTTYFVRYSGTCNTTTCATVIVNVNDVTGGTVGTDQTICSGGDPAAFTQSVASTGTALTYRWQSSTTDCANGFSDIMPLATGTLYDPPAGLLVKTYYRRITTSTLNGVPCTAISNCISVTINNVTGGTVAANQSICSGGDPLEITQSIASAGTALTYKWQSSTTDCSNGFSDIMPLATGTTYDPPAGLTATTYYRRVTTSTLNGVPCAANSNCITITIIPNNTITLTSAPGTDAQMVCVNKPITNITYSTTTATGATFSELPAGVTGAWAANVVTISGTPTAAGTFNYMVTLTGGCGVVTATGTITVNPAPVVSISGGGTFCGGTTVTLTATAGFASYNWFRFTNTGYVAIGVTTPTLTVTKSGNFQVVVSNGTCEGAAGESVEIGDYVFTGAMAAGDATQANRLFIGGTTSTCAAPKACPGNGGAAGPFVYDLYTVTNINANPVCAIIALTGNCDEFVTATAYLGSYNPANNCTNYLGDLGSAVIGGPLAMEVTIPGNATIVIKVNNFQSGLYCNNYRVVVDIPRASAGISVSPPSPQCAGNPITLTASLANSYSWNPGGATTQAIVHTTGTTSYTVTLGYGNGTCTATASTTVSVGNPVADPMANQGFCNGAAASAVFTGTAGTTFNWTNSNTAIGLPASGSGNLNFTATNSGSAPIVGNITVTPASGTCTGTPITFTIAVNPIPTVTQPASQTVCRNTSTNAVNFSGTVSGTIFNWTNNTPSIGLAANGSGNIAPFIAMNATNSPVTATITVTPAYTNGATTCYGTPQTFTITVNTETESADVLAYTSNTQTGNQAHRGELGMEFIVNQPGGIKIKQLGAFDDGGNGITGLQPGGGVRVAIFNRSTHLIVPGLDVTISGLGNAYTSGHRMVNLATPIVLPPGDYVIVAKGYHAGERNGNSLNGGALYPAGNDGGGAITFGAETSYGLDDPNGFNYPTNAGNFGDSHIFLAGTFDFTTAAPCSPSSGGCESGAALAYSSNTTTGNQAHRGELGMQFMVTNPGGINIKQLGCFDDLGNGITGLQPGGGVRVAIFNRNTHVIVPGLDVTIIGTAGSLAGNHRLVNITPVTLPPGDYVIVAKGYNSTERNGNSFQGGGPYPPGNNGGGAIAFGNETSYGPDDPNSFSYPSSALTLADTHVFLAGTFNFTAVLPCGGTCESPPAQAYVANTQTGNNSHRGELGLQFIVNHPGGINIKRLGAFDDGGNGINGLQPGGGVRVAIFNRNTHAMVPGLDVTISGNAGTLVGNHRLVNLAAPVTLLPGDYVLVAKGYNVNEKNGNSYQGGGPYPTGDNGGNAITYGTEASYGPDDPTGFNYPGSSVNNGDPHVFLAGTFDFTINVNCPTAPEVDLLMPTTAIAKPVEGSKPQLKVETRDMNIYPNPGTGQFNLQLSNVSASKLTIQIMNANGKLVIQKTMTVTGKTASMVIPFNLADQPSGGYLIKVQSAEGIQTKKLVIRR